MIFLDLIGMMLKKNTENRTPPPRSSTVYVIIFEWRSRYKVIKQNVPGGCLVVSVLALYIAKY